jgi:hypothetical protein
MAWLQKFLKALFHIENTPANTVVMALSLMVAIWIASAGFAVGAILLCLVIAALSAIVLVIQWREAWGKVVQDDAMYAAFRADYTGWPKEWKRALKEVANRGSLESGDIENSVRYCGLVLWDERMGRYRLTPQLARIARRLIRDSGANRATGKQCANGDQDKPTRFPVRS